jgi:hypothetical protein
LLRKQAYFIQVFPIKKVIFSAVSGGDASGIKAPAEDPFQCSQALEIAEDKPHGKLPPVSGGENTRNRISILFYLINTLNNGPCISAGTVIQI